MSRVQGTVKWFSNKKGYGFIEPTSKDAPTTEELFVHQSSIKSDGFRSLVEGWIVEFEIVNDSDGKLKADKVTAPGGGPCTGPKRQRRKKAEEEPKDSPAPGGRNNEKTDKKRTPKKQSEKPWHDILSADAKNNLTSKGIKYTTGTVDVSIGKERLKLGTRAYVAMAHADGILAEGTFAADKSGVIKLTWNHALRYEGGEWKAMSTDGLSSGFTLTDDSVVAVGPDETPETLWGTGKTDPKEMLSKEGFQMRRVVLTPKIRSDASK
eukprot:CAMPEP_0178926186 /NCGR_PEP_ID=MMETSP0786-20121207/18373_1 /TAXON_ID=186022 /ORGANISM="Thalassionema frauenfeldii, Strain CCMP 1798" /LENGTH=265 /DNA_ID=CAMNT_0020601241 /DNA_START=33 /DNA_END=830 /DNA_ORIENTATION=-